MKMSVLVGFMYCLAATGVVTSSRAAQEEKQKASDRNKVKLVVAGSLTAEPVAHTVTYDAIYGAEFGVGVQDSDSNSAFVAACVAQFPSKGNQIVKTFAGLPFVVESLTPDKDVELSDPIRITLVGGATEMAWKNTQSSRQRGQNHIDGEKGGVRLNGMWLLAAGTSVTDWGVLRQNRGQNIAIPERYLNKLRVWATLAKSNVIIPSAGSEVPCLCDREGFPSRIVPKAIGIVWVFEKAGTEIVVGTERYRAEKDGATIQFTTAGPVLKDAVKSVSQQPQTMSPVLEPTAQKQSARTDRDTKDAAVVFGPGSPGSMRVSYKGKVIQASQVGQSTAVRVVEKNGKTEEIRVPVSLWSSVPFHAGATISVKGYGELPLGTLDMGYKDFCFLKERTIEIEESDDGFLLMPSKDSLIPIWIDATGTEIRPQVLAHAANVTWVFKKEGVKFETITHTYVTIKPGAKISFTKDGVKLDGVTATAKKKSDDADRASEEKEFEVGYSCASFPQITSGRVGQSWRLPEKKFVFDEKMDAQYALTAKIGERQITCPLAYQDVAYVFDKGEKHTVQILAYNGCPLQVKDISLEKDIVLREETTLLMDSTKGSVLQLAKDSSLPFVTGPSGLIAMCATAVNAVWRFPNAGMAFDTKDAVYTTTKPGASIAFTKDGIKMDGIDKKAKTPTPK